MDDDEDEIRTPADRWKAGEYAQVRAAKGHGWWNVKVLEVSADGRFAKVSSGFRGQLAKPRWVATNTPQPPGSELTEGAGAKRPALLGKAGRW